MQKVTNEQLSKMCSEFQSKYHTALIKSEKYAAILYDIEHKDDPEPTEAELKAQVMYFKSELNKAIDGRDKAKGKAKRQSAIIHSMREVIELLKKTEI